MSVAPPGPEGKGVRNPGRLIAAGFALVIALMVGLAYFHRAGVAEGRQILDRLIAVEDVAIEQLAVMLNASRERALVLHDISITSDPFGREEKLQKFYDLAVVFGNARQKLLALDLDDHEKAMLEQQRIATSRTLALQQQVIDLVQAGKVNEAQLLLVEQAIPAQDEVLSLLRTIHEHEIEDARRLAEAGTRHLKKLAGLTGYVASAAVALALLIAALVGAHTSALVRGLVFTSDKLEKAVKNLEDQKFALDQHAIVSIADAAGAIIYANDKFCEVSGYAREELIGQNHRLLKSIHHSPSFYEQMWETITAGKVWRGEVCNRNKGGGQYWVETTIVPFLDESGLPYQYVSIRTEITQVKRVEDELRRGRDDLERMVVERTAELTHANDELQSEIERRRLLEEHLQTLATTDALTQIFNRRKFDEMLARETARAGRYAQPFSLILFDIDHFKQLNDRFGHQAGDAALSQLAGRVVPAIRASDIFARWGGEEFVILVPGATAENARLLAEKLRSEIEHGEFAPVGQLTCSFGVAEFRKGDSADDLLRRADQALYRAKQGGRNRVEAA